MSKHQFTDVRIAIEGDNIAIMRDEKKCIKCGNCKRVCETDMAVGSLYNLKDTFDIPICVHCGQCANVCPTNAITERFEYGKVRNIIKRGDKIVVFNTSPSVRVGLGEEFGLEAGTDVEGKMVAALRKLGASFVLDTNFSADMTTGEEANELIQRILNPNKQKPLPQFTSCCPAWVKFAETFYGDFLLPHISTSKSPLGMQGPIVKTYFADKNKIDPKNIINVAVTPCTAKKFELRRPEQHVSAEVHHEREMRDFDFVITTRELAMWMREEGIDLKNLADAQYDSLMGAASGAAMIYGNTGGVMESAVRSAYFTATGEHPPADLLQFEGVRGLEGIKAASLTLPGGKTVRVAVCNGLSNAKVLVDKFRAEGSLPFEFIEVMACRGGCIGGGGQPKPKMAITADVKKRMLEAGCPESEIPATQHTLVTDAIRQKRIATLYNKDVHAQKRLANDNPDHIRIYKEFFGGLGSEKAESYLHTHSYLNRASDLGAKK